MKKRFSNCSKFNVTEPKRDLIKSLQKQYHREAKQKNVIEVEF